MKEFKHVKIVNSPFSSMFDHLAERNIIPTHILLDLGVSSFKLINHYVVTFQRDEPLDMRMDINSSTTAHKLLSSYTEEQLIYMFETEGDIRQPHRLVEQIINRRNNNLLNSTFDLVDCVKYGFFVRSRQQFIAMYQSISSHSCRSEW